MAGYGSFVVSNAYDELDRPVTATYPNGIAKIGYNYGLIGNLESLSSLSGAGSNNVTFYTVDEVNELGQVMKVTYGNGVVSRFSYYPLSRRVRQTMTGKVNGDTYQSLGYKYTAGGLIKDIVDNVRTGGQAATLASIQYDNLYRLSSVQRFDPVTNGLKAFTFAYDASGNITRNDDFSTDLTYQYTNQRPHALSSIGTNVFFYDAIGNITGSLGRVLEYDAQNRLKRVTTPSGVVANFRYLDSGARIIKEVVSGGTTNTTLYLGGLYEEKDGEALCHVFFGGKRVASFTPIEEGGGQAFGLWQRFARFMDADRASGKWFLALPALWKEGPLRRYVTVARADPQIPLKVMEGMFLLGLTVSCCCSGAAVKRLWADFFLLLHFPFRILARPRSTLRLAGGGLKRGLCLLLTVVIFLTMIPSVATAQSFPRGDVNGDANVDVADAMLIQQVVDGRRQTDDSVFGAGFFNGDVNYDGATNATDTRIIMEYAVGLRSLPPAPEQTQKFLYYHTDHLGSSNVVTDRSGNLVQHMEYTPFGETRCSLDLGQSINSFLYTGQEYDAEIGLYYYNARYYDSKIGRFIQPDTLIPNPADSQAYNRYAYVRNNPVMMSDPSGHLAVRVRLPDGTWSRPMCGLGYADWKRGHERTKPKAGQSVSMYEINAQLRALGVTNLPPLGAKYEEDLWHRHLLRDYLMTGELHPDGVHDMIRKGYRTPEEYFSDMPREVASRIARHERHKALAVSIAMTVAITVVTGGVGGVISGAASSAGFAAGLGISAAAAGISTAFLQGTGEGRQLVERTAKEVVDDVFGVNHEGTARQIASAALHMVTTAALETVGGILQSHGKIATPSDEASNVPTTPAEPGSINSFDMGDAEFAYALKVTGQKELVRNVGVTIRSTQPPILGMQHVAYRALGETVPVLPFRTVLASQNCLTVVANQALSDGYFLSPAVLANTAGGYAWGAVTTLAFGTYGSQFYQNAWYASRDQ